MSTTLEQIKPETLAIIEEQAKNSGLSVDEYLRSLLAKIENATSLKAPISDEEFEADMLAFAEGTENDSKYQGTYSRADIYEG